MKLYYTPGACSLSPHIVMREAGYDPELVKVDLRSKKMAGGGDFLEVNATGYVPVVELDDGSILTEGPAIVQYIADLKPESGLAPANGSRARYDVQSWLNFISTELHKSYSPLFKPDSTEDQKTAARALLDKRYTYLAGVMADRDYLVGNTFSVADVYLFVVNSWANYIKYDLSRWPVLLEFQKRIAARPAVQATLKAEGLA